MLRPDALRLRLATVTPALLHDPACGHILPGARLGQVLRVTCTLDNGGPRPQTFALRATHAPQHPLRRRLDWYRRIAAHGSRHYLGLFGGSAYANG